jgi:putative ABC transport system substrate-binding protein
VFTTAGDPVGAGLVDGLSRPGGNITGVTTLGTELGPKRLEILHESVPAPTAFAMLRNPTSGLSTAIGTANLQAAARTLGLQLHVLQAGTERDIDAAFASLPALGVGGVLTTIDAFLNTQSEQLAALSLRYRLPMISYVREFAVAGGLMSYGGSSTDMYRIVGGYAARILKGEKPADLPVQQSTKVELIINMKTAKALGITFPLTLLGRADEVIE